MLILLVLVGSVPNVLNQLVFIGLKWWLQLDHQVLTLPGAPFLGCLGGFVGVESKGIQGEVV